MNSLVRLLTAGALALTAPLPLTAAALTAIVATSGVAVLATATAEAATTVAATSLTVTTAAEAATTATATAEATTATATAEATATATTLTSGSLVNADVTSIELRVVHLRNGGIGAGLSSGALVLGLLELNETVSTAAAGLAVLDNEGGLDLAVLLEVLSQGLLVRGPREASDEKLRHGDRCC